MNKFTATEAGHALEDIFQAVEDGEDHIESQKNFQIVNQIVSLKR